MTTNYSSKAGILMHLTLPGEHWREVRDSDGRYQVSNLGRIASMNYRSRAGALGTVAVMTPAPDANGYLRTMMRRGGKWVTVKVHRIVAEHWVPNPEGKAEVNHVDFDRQNNRADNLEWTTRAENREHTLSAGRSTKNNGQKNGMSVLTEDAVRTIRREYRPYVTQAQTFADRFGVSRAAIKDILRGRTWKHVN